MSKPMISISFGTLKRPSFFIVENKRILQKLTHAIIATRPRSYTPKSFIPSLGLYRRPFSVLKIPTQRTPQEPPPRCTGEASNGSSMWYLSIRSTPIE